MLRKNEPRHMLRARVQNWSRRRRMAAGAGVAAAAVGGFALAWALLTVNAPIQGGGDIAAPADVAITAANVFSETGVDCQVALVADGGMSLNMLGGVQNGTCEVDLTLKRTGQTTPAVKVSDLKFADAVTEQIAGTGCGKDVTTAGTVIRTRFTLTGAPTPSFTALPDAGIYATDGSTTLCPSGPA
jgi:hypothetical protein